MGWSAVVAGTGGDYVDINTAITNLAAGDSIYVKTGTYTGAVNVSKAVYVFIEPGTSFTHASGFTISAAKSAVLFGNGCSITEQITISAADCWVSARNGLSAENFIVSSGADRVFIDLGGWGSLIDGSTLVDAMALDANDAIIQNGAWNNDTAGARRTFDVGSGAAAARTVLRLNKALDSGAVCVHLDSASVDFLADGMYIADSDTAGHNINAPRSRVYANSIVDSNGVAYNVGASGDDSICCGNIGKSATGDVIDINTNGENTVVYANNISGTLDDNSETSTVEANDLGDASLAVTGTAQSASITETDVVNGGKTLILTLTNAVWQNIPAADFATAFQALLTGDQDGNTVGWDDVKTTILASGAFARTSDTVLTITYAAAGTYDIAANETVTLADVNNDTLRITHSAPTVLGSEISLTPDDGSYSVTTV
jgi:hypothetical protein